MKQSILGQAAHTYKKQLHRRIGLCMVAALVTFGLNLLLVALHTDANHGIFLALNIGADILCGIFVLYYVEMHIRPQRKLYKLFIRQRQLLTGTVDSVSPQVQRYLDLDCYAVTINERKVFLPANTIKLEPGSCTLSLVSNVIVEVEQ